jgi:hypothetical protein
MRGRTGPAPFRDRLKELEVLTVMRCLGCESGELITVRWSGRETGFTHVERRELARSPLPRCFARDVSS